MFYSITFTCLKDYSHLTYEEDNCIESSKNMTKRDRDFGGYAPCFRGRFCSDAEAIEFTRKIANKINEKARRENEPTITCCRICNGNTVWFLKETGNDFEIDILNSSWDYECYWERDLKIRYTEIKDDTYGHYGTYEAGSDILRKLKSHWDKGWRRRFSELIREKRKQNPGVRSWKLNEGTVLQPSPDFEPLEF